MHLLACIRFVSWSEYHFVSFSLQRDWRNSVSSAKLEGQIQTYRETRRLREDWWQVMNRPDAQQGARTGALWRSSGCIQDRIRGLAIWSTMTFCFTALPKAYEQLSCRPSQSRRAPYAFAYPHRQALPRHFCLEFAKVVERRGKRVCLLFALN